MSWLAHMDARSQCWPRGLRWTYRGAKWSLIALGAWLAIELAITERGGLGLGIVVAMLLAAIKGIAIAMRTRH